MKTNEKTTQDIAGMIGNLLHTCSTVPGNQRLKPGIVTRDESDDFIDTRPIEHIGTRSNETHVLIEGAEYVLTVSRVG